MIARKYRLPWGVKFNNGYYLSTPLFKVRIKPNSLSLNRFAVIVSKKIDKRAVVRNRIRRLMYTSLMELFEQINKGYDTLFITAKGSLGKTKNDFYVEIEKVFRKHNLLK